MTTKQLLVCDGCGTEATLQQADGWMELRTYIASQDFMDKVQNARFYGGDDGTNHGDFCSLVCLVNFAGTQQVLRDVTEGYE